MKERDWDSFSIEPRPELWSKLEERLEVEKDKNLVRVNLKRQMFFAAASVLLVFGMGFYWMFGFNGLSAESKKLATEIIFMDSAEARHFAAERDIYFGFNKIEEGTSNSKLVVRKNNSI